MHLNDAHIETFQALYERRFGCKLTTEEAITKATQLLQMMEAILRQKAKFSLSPHEAVRIG